MLCQYIVRIVWLDVVANDAANMRCMLVCSSTTAPSPKTEVSGYDLIATNRLTVNTTLERVYLRFLRGNPLVGGRQDGEYSHKKKTGWR